MKSIVGWLSDPWLHLLGIGLVVVVVGSGRMNPAAPPSSSTGPPSCDHCSRHHEVGSSCFEAVTARDVAGRGG